MHHQETGIVDYLREFLRLESASGILLFAAAILALIAENSPLDQYYNLLLSMPVEIRVGNLEIAKPLLLWINDGLMAIFFFLVGLEIKREVLEGELSDANTVMLPAVGALGGMLVPALIYSYLNWADDVAIQGWAIPSATDIAFALGVLALLGDRVPNSLKLFLLTLAIIDDIGAIIIIAVFYSGELSATSLAIAATCVILLWIFNRRGIVDTAPYLLVGIILWVTVLKSGIHATLAGLILAFFIPLTSKSGYSPLKHMEEDLHPAVAFAILPIFAFANVGIPLEGLTFASILEPIPLGIALGLFFGNQIGVFGLGFIAVKTGLCRLPEGISWLSLYGVACLCGIGFTMSLFISSLAFEITGADLILNDRLGILIGSMLSAVWGVTVLAISLPRPKTATDPG